jgi:hypothetical protein
MVVAYHLQMLSADVQYSVGCLVIVWAYRSVEGWLRGEITGLVTLGLYQIYKVHGLTAIGHLSWSRTLIDPFDRLEREGGCMRHHHWAEKRS